MRIKMIKDEDFSSYKEVSMLIAFPTCNFKCCTDAKRPISMCQNSPIAQLPDVDIPVADIYERYRRNVITHSIVCGGLEPIDSMAELCQLIATFREHGCDDPFIIYTGYNEDEFDPSWLKSFPNIIVKYGRFIPGQTPHYDELLGVMLASPNQYAKKFFDDVQII